MADTKRRFVWLDALVVILAVFFVARYLYLHYGPGKEIGRQLRPVKVQMLFADLRGPVLKVLRPGDQLVNAHTGSPLGTVVAVDRVPSTVWKNGVAGKSTDYQDLYVTVQGEGQVTPVATIVGSTQIHVGTVVPTQSNLFQDDDGIVWKIYAGGGAK